MADRLERLLNLTASLLDARRPLTLEELARTLEPAYPEALGARRRAFERDKETLRELGIPISTEPVDDLGGELGYRIRAQDYYLPEPGLTHDERAALHVAVTAVRLGGDASRDGLQKLGGAEGAPAAPFAALETTSGLAELFEAVAKHCTVTFPHRGTSRRLEPYGVVHRFGHWYVVGHDLDRDAQRAFRVDRIEGPPVLGPSGAFEPPPGFDPAQALRGDPMTFGEAEPIEAHVLVDASHATWVVHELGDDALVGERDDGGVEVVVRVVNRDAFRTFVCGLLEHAEVLSPPELRAEFVAALRTLERSVTQEPGARRRDRNRTAR